MPQSLLIFGATSYVGMETLAQALDSGYRVTAVVPSLKNLESFKHHNLRFVVADENNASTYLNLMSGHDAVISCWGQCKRSPANKNLHLSAVREICQAMNEAKIRRGVFMTCWGTKQTSSVPYRKKFQLLAKLRSLEDMAMMEDFLEMYSGDINYTVVRPPLNVTEGPATDASFVVKDNDYFLKGMSNKMPRGDVARFLLECLESELYDRKMLTIGLEKSLGKN